jgi:CheY-like chemotaxis protein
MKKVLIIDDEPRIREVLTTILEGKYELQEAGSRKEGMKVLKEFIPDLIVLDVMMEDLDSGFEMAREIRQDEELKDIKILILTSADQEMDMDFKKFAGDEEWLPVDGYINKPIKPKEFLAKVEKLIGA